MTELHDHTHDWLRLGADPDRPDGDGSNERAIAVDTARPKLRPPRMYRVLLLNDDYTPMDFVVGVLVNFFAMNVEQATQVMLQVHTRGRGVCGIYTHEIAETKVAQVTHHARTEGHPLKCTMEEA